MACIPFSPFKLAALSIGFLGVSSLASGAVPSANAFLNEEVFPADRLKVSPMSELAADLRSSQERFFRALNMSIPKVVAELRAAEPEAVAMSGSGSSQSSE